MRNLGAAVTWEKDKEQWTWGGGRRQMRVDAQPQALSAGQASHLSTSFQGSGCKSGRAALKRIHATAWTAGHTSEGMPIGDAGGIVQQQSSQGARLGPAAGSRIQEAAWACATVILLQINCR
jgi:hypothetical protein